MPPIAEPSDLLQHNCLVYTLQPTDRWFFRHPAEAGDAFEQVPVTGTLRADDAEPLRDAAVARVGDGAPPPCLGAGRDKTGVPAPTSAAKHFANPQTPNNKLVAFAPH